MERRTDESEHFAWGVLLTIAILAAAIVCSAYFAWYKPAHPELNVTSVTANITVGVLGIALPRNEG